MAQQKLAPLILLSACGILLGANEHVVEHGETLSEIAQKRFGGRVYGPNNSLQRLILNNPQIENPNIIFPGDEIILVPSKKEVLEISADLTPLSVPVEVIPERPTPFALSVGISDISYKETGKPSLLEKAITVKASYRYALPFEGWDTAISTYFSALAFSSNIPGYSSRFLGINFRIGYALPFVTEPWKLGIMGGWYFTTMFTTNNRFGFENLQGPQLFPVIQYKLNVRSYLSGYLKYSPIMNGNSLMAISNREFALGGGYNRRFRNGQIGSLNIDWANLKFKILRKAIDSRSLSLSGGVSF